MTPEDLDLAAIGNQAVAMVDAVATVMVDPGSDCRDRPQTVRFFLSR